MSQVTNGRNNDEVAGGDVAVRDRVSMALSDHPETADAVIEVMVDRGVVTLAGEVDSAETRVVAEQVTAAQPRVVSVNNTLQVSH